MKDQHLHWNQAHAERWLYPYSTRPSEFAQAVNAVIPSNSSILELGCGEGNDAQYFAAAGHEVLATDFSEVVLARDRARWPSSNLQFLLHDTSKPFSLPDESFDVIYARLSLQYFTDETTRRVFSELYRLLKPAGYLCFLGKEVHAPIYGRGDEIEPDMFELEGHVRHFFSKAYTEQLLRTTSFKIEKLSVATGLIYENWSSWISVVARKIGDEPTGKNNAELL